MIEQIEFGRLVASIKPVEDPSHSIFNLTVRQNLTTGKPALCPVDQKRRRIYIERSHRPQGYAKVSLKVEIVQSCQQHDD